jgi:phosphomannomutase
VRGVVPDEFNTDLARKIGAAFARLAQAEAVIVVRDMRASSIPLSAAFAEGVISQGLDVIDAGLGSTGLLYFAAGHLNLPGAVFTASHNPTKYNGIKMCVAGAARECPMNGVTDGNQDH